jgi:hypothetical protein
MDASSALRITGLRPNKSTRGSGRSSTSPRGCESGDSNPSKLTNVFATMQLTGPDMSLGLVMPILLAIKPCIFEARIEHYSNLFLLLNESFVYLLCLCVFTGRAKRGMSKQVRSRIRVPAIVFDYPRHSGATDEGMTNEPSIFTYLVFGPGGTSAEEIARPMKLAIWRGPGARLGVQCKIRKRRTSRIRTHLGFIQTDSICNWLGEQSRDPTFAHKRLGGKSENLSRHFSPPSTRALVILRALHLRARSHLRLHCNQPL